MTEEELAEERDPNYLLVKFTQRLAEAKLAKGNYEALIDELQEIVERLREEVHGSAN